MNLKNIKQAFIDTVDEKRKANMKISPFEEKRYKAYKKALAKKK
tara:strand:- start:53 stop:184 length:132 start_codon:yes stop_codon:yes gene_type:complete